MCPKGSSSCSGLWRLWGVWGLAGSGSRGSRGSRGRDLKQDEQEKEEEEDIPYMPCEMLAAGENHVTVAKALALKGLCWCGTVAFARRRKGHLLWVACWVQVGLGGGRIDRRDMAGGRRVVEGSRGGGGGGGDCSSYCSSIWTENAGMVDSELDGSLLSSSGSLLNSGEWVDVVVGWVVCSVVHESGRGSRVAGRGRGRCLSRWW